MKMILQYAFDQKKFKRTDTDALIHPFSSCVTTKQGKIKSVKG